MNRPRRYGGEMSDESSVPTRLAAFSFDDELRAAEFLTAMTRLARDKRVKIHDAVFVVKSPEGKTSVRETTDLQPGQTAMGSAVWSGLFGLLLGGPVGMLVAGGIGAGAGALTAKLIDVGVSDDFVEQLREQVQPSTTTLALLVDVRDDEAVLTELRRFEGARYVAGDLPLDRIAIVRDALGDGAPISGDEFPPPTDPPAT